MPPKERFMQHVILSFLTVREFRIILHCCIYKKLIVCPNSCTLFLHWHLLLNNWMNWMPAGIMAYVEFFITTNGRVSALLLPLERLNVKHLIMLHKINL